MRAVLFAMLMALFASATCAAEQSIVGVWYEDVTYGGSRQISVWTIKADGSFISQFRKCLSPGEDDSTDIGHWTYSNGHLQTITDGGVMGAASVVDEYQTESNDGHVWVYRGVGGPNFERYGPVKFRDIRVEPGSKLPACDLSS